MDKFLKAVHTPALALALSFGLPAIAYSADANAVAERLKALFDKQGILVEYAEVAEDGDIILLKGTSFGVPGEDVRIQVGTVTLENVEDFEGGYRVGAMAFPNYAFSEEEIGVLAEDIFIEGLRIPAEGNPGIFGEMLIYENLEIGIVSVKMKDEEVFVLENANAQIDIPQSADEKMVYTGGVERMFVNLAGIDDPQVQQTMQALGYEQLTGRVQMGGYWIPSSGRLVLEENRYSVDDAVSFNVTLDVDGYTPELASQVQTMSRQMQEAEGADQQAQGLAMLGLLQQLNFHSATIRIDDSSLTGRLLDFFSAQQGMDRATMVNQTKGVLPFMLGQLGNPAFATQITNAVSDYLDNPQSLEIRAEPGEPIPFALLMATGMSAPQSLPDQLSVTVTANK